MLLTIYNLVRARFEWIYIIKFGHGHRQGEGQIFENITAPS